MKWYITLYGSDRRKIEQTKLSYTVQQSGREVELIDIEPFWNSLLQKSHEKECAIVNGPIRITTLSESNRPNWIPGSWHDVELYSCRNYYSYWGKYLTQSCYCFLTLAELRRRVDWIYNTFSVDETVFIRPDYGEKSFNGELVAREHFKRFETMNDFDLANPVTLCVVSKPKVIKKELRLVVFNNRVVTGSTYRIGNNIIQESLEEQSDKEAIVEFTERVIADNPPPLPPVYGFDVAMEETQYEDKYSVLEVGCVNCAGYYASDLCKIVDAISEAAEKQYSETLSNNNPFGTPGNS